MNKILRCVLLLALSSCVPLQAASAAATTKRVHGAAAGGDFIISCDSGPIASDYVAQTASGVPSTDPYAVARGADKGLVRLMGEGGRRVRTYVIPRRRIRAIVTVKLDADVLDRLDLVFTAKDLIAIHTSTANAGIFTSSDVYRLPFGRDRRVDRTPLQGNEDLLRMPDLGFSAYQPRTAACSP